MKYKVHILNYRSTRMSGCVHGRGQYFQIISQRCGIYYSFDIFILPFRMDKMGKVCLLLLLHSGMGGTQVLVICEAQLPHCISL